MRGNHQQLGRRDYAEPARLSDSDLSLIAQCRISPIAANSRALWRTHEVIRGGQVIGYVTTRLEGQLYKAAKNKKWRFAASDWSRVDPMHGKAILALLDALESNEANAPVQPNCAETL